MTELVHERFIELTDPDGRLYDRARIYATRQRGSTWRGSIRFVPVDGTDPLETGPETTQSTLEGVAYWATGLEALYFEGALERALRRAQPSPAAAAVAGAPVGAVPMAVETLDPEVPLRLMGTRTVVPGLTRRIHNGGLLIYQGSDGDESGRYRFLVQFASDNAAALLANTLWNELHGTGAVLEIEGTAVVMRNAAIKDALRGALVR
jgi:hypothetical protein